MKPEDLNWMINQGRLSELRMFRDVFYDLVMGQQNRDDLVNKSFDYFRNRIRDLEDTL
jgi:hypothetical protein